jgi:hypothetical protein
MSINDRVVVHPKNPYERASGPDLGALLGLQAKAGSIMWDHVDGQLLHAAVANWTAGGHAITLGKTSDGGALSISLLSGGKPYKLYAATADEANDLLTRIGGLERP